MTPKVNPMTNPVAPRRSPWRLTTAATVVLAVAGLGASLAQAQPGPMMKGEHGARHAAHHPAGGPGMPGGMMLPERALDEVGATPEQKAKVRDIAKAARDDLQKQHEAGRDLHQKMMALMAAPTIDTAAAEALRQQQLARHDAVSKRMLQAMLDVQAVLTPDQRAKLAERMKTRMDRMEHRHERGGMGAPRG